MNDDPENFANCLAMLHYSEAWRDSGLIDAAFVRRQCQEYVSGDDCSREHYRWKAFCAILETHRALSDGELERFVALAVADEDRTMAESVLSRLVAWPGLSEAQWTWLASSPAFASPNIQRIILRTRLLHEIAEGAVTDDLVQLALGSADAHVQRALLGNKALTQSQLAVLREHGASRAIRNIAANRIGSPHRER